jgi:hypothetical protein
MHLTEAQLAELRKAGASLDAKDMEMADRLGRKGFVGDEFVAAYRECKAMKAKYLELASFGRDMVETVAVAQRLGLNDEDRYWFVWDRHHPAHPPAQSSDDRAPSGRGMVTFGAVATGLGIVLLVVGEAMASDQTYDQEKYRNVPSGWGYAGKAMEVTGGVSIAAGLAVTVLGLYRWTTPPPDDVPDERAANRSPSALAQSRPALRWELTPSLGPQHVGLGLSGAF